MPAVPAGRIEFRQSPRIGNRVCGTCGALIAEEHIARHIDWHALAPAAAFPAAVTNAVPAVVSN